MAKALYIAEKPSVAREFAAALGEPLKKHEGYQESEHAVITWCIGHLVTMSYPDAYDARYKKWSMATLPFLPSEYLYEIIPSAKKQFDIVSGLLNRADVDTIYVCTDSGREGEYIYRLVDRMAHVEGKRKKRVWIDSQTEEEILRGIREAKDLSAYDHLAASAYLRAQEDYLMGINFSRVLTLKYGSAMAGVLNERYCVISAGRVMTCVLGMVVSREREIRAFVKTPFFKVYADLSYQGGTLQAEWKAAEGSAYEGSPKLYRDNGFLKREDAQELIGTLKDISPPEALILKTERKTEKKNPPLLYNLAELQNDCAKFFKISPDETLKIAQELYEKKLVTYPRTDARVLSSAVAKEIGKNLSGLAGINMVKGFVQEILSSGRHKTIAKTRYTDDKKITDHYAIIPTGQGLSAMKSLSHTALCVYEAIVRRFLAIFYDPAQYQKLSMTAQIGRELFFAGEKVLKVPGYLNVMEYTFLKKKEEEQPAGTFDGIRKGMRLPVAGFEIREGETKPPKRYHSGSLILAMENAGQLIEDEQLREQIRGSGIGTSATRAEILRKLVKNGYLTLNKKTQIISPALMGEMIYDVVNAAIRPLLNPELTASWEKGLSYVAEGTITPQEYKEKLSDFIRRRTEYVKGLSCDEAMIRSFEGLLAFYKKPVKRYRK